MLSTKGRWADVVNSVRLYLKLPILCLHGDPLGLYGGILDFSMFSINFIKQNTHQR